MGLKHNSQDMNTLVHYFLSIKLNPCPWFFNLNLQRGSESRAKFLKAEPKDEEEEEGVEEEDEEEQGETHCGACGESYAADEFWICCDLCENWFHGKCVKITPARAEHIKQYKCPSCSNKRARS